MPSINWVIQKEFLESGYAGQPGLDVSARFLGHGVIVMSRDDLEAGAACFPKGNCVIAHGSHRFINSFKKRFAGHYQPGSYHLLDNLRYSSYAHRLSDVLLNEEYIILPLGDVPRRCADLSKEIFIRPVSVAKPFTGRVTTLGSCLAELHGQLHVSLDELVVVARPRPINREYRFVVADGTVIAGSRYCWPHQLEQMASDYSSIATEAVALAEDVARRAWQPDRVYVCDICEVYMEGKMSGGFEWKVVELNTFSCSGFYAMNTIDIARKVGEAAWKEFAGDDDEHNAIGG